MAEHRCTTIKINHPGILRDLPAKFDNFWDIARKELEELHALTLDDGHYAEKANGEVIINLALEISLRSRYQ